MDHTDKKCQILKLTCPTSQRRSRKSLTTLTRGGAYGAVVAGPPTDPPTARRPGVRRNSPLPPQLPDQVERIEAEDRIRQGHLNFCVLVSFGLRLFSKNVFLLLQQVLTFFQSVMSHWRFKMHWTLFIRPVNTFLGIPNSN